MQSSNATSCKVHNRLIICNEKLIIYTNIKINYSPKKISIFTTIFYTQINAKKMTKHNVFPNIT